MIHLDLAKPQFAPWSFFSGQRTDVLDHWHWQSCLLQLNLSEFCAAILVVDVTFLGFLLSVNSQVHPCHCSCTMIIIT